MGDRGNIKIIGTGTHPVYLYTHWGGSAIAEVAVAALKRAPDRWTDGPYLARVIFCEMTKNETLETTGYGISTDICDNEHPILTIDTNTASAWFENERGEHIDSAIYSFAAFIAKYGDSA